MRGNMFRKVENWNIKKQWNCTNKTNRYRFSTTRYAIGFVTWWQPYWSHRNAAWYELCPNTIKDLHFCICWSSTLC